MAAGTTAFEESRTVPEISVACARNGEASKTALKTLTDLPFRRGSGLLAIIVRFSPAPRKPFTCFCKLDLPRFQPLTKIDPRIHLTAMYLEVRGEVQNRFRKAAPR